MYADFQLMVAAFNIDTSEMDAGDNLMDVAAIFARILDFQNERGHPFLTKYGVKNVVKLHFDNEKNPRPDNVNTYPTFINGPPRPFSETLRNM